MRLRPQKRSLVVAGVAIVAFMIGAATVVLAGGSPTLGIGSTITRVKTVASAGSFEAVNPSSVNLPGARHRMVLSGSSTLVVARFVATIDCPGVPGRCHAQVAVLDNNDGDSLVGYMHGPFHMDSTFGNEGHENHSLENSMTLPSGDYDFQVQLSTFYCCGTTEGDITVSIPAWHFTVERIVP